MRVEELIVKILTLPVILTGVYVFLLSYHYSNFVIRWMYYIMAIILWAISVSVLIARIEVPVKEQPEKQKERPRK